MAYSPSEKYPGAVDSDPNYKGGKFRDNNPSTTNNGSPLKAIDRNELLARDEAIMNDAGFDYNGLPDTPQDSQLFKAYKASLGNGANLITSNPNFRVPSDSTTGPDATEPAPDGTPRDYPANFEIFYNWFTGTFGVTNLTYTNGAINEDDPAIVRSGKIYTDIQKKDGVEYLSDLSASVSGKDLSPIQDGVLISDEGANYRVTIDLAVVSDVFIAKLEASKYPTKHDLSVASIDGTGGVITITSDPVQFTDGQFEYNFSGFNAYFSSFYIYSPSDSFPNQLLIEGKDYTFLQGDPETITLTSSWSGGFIIAKNIEPQGSIPKTSYTVDGLVDESGLNGGDEVVVPELGNARYVIQPTGFTALTGDISIASGQVAHLQKDSTGQFNVRWFGASGSDGSIDQTAYFNIAATRYSEEENGSGKAPDIVVPVGNWRLDSETLEASWVLARGADIEGLGGVAPTGVNDTSRLKGRVINYNQGYNQFNSVRFGDQTYAVQKYTSKAFIAEVMSFGRPEVGGGGGAFGVNVKDRPGGQNATGIGLTGVAVNDMDNDYAATWGLYVESTKGPTATGPTWGAEITTVNQNPTLVTQTPYRQGSGSGATFGLMVNSGDELDGSYPSQVVSCAMDIFGKAGGTFHRGIIFREGGIDSQEMVTAPSGYKLTWYGENLSGDEVQAAEIIGVLPGNTGQLTLRAYGGLGVAHDVALTPTDLSPVDDNSLDYGVPSRRIKTVYTYNVDNVSDQNKKKQRGSLNQNEKAAALQIARLPRMFQWIAEAQEKKSLSGQTVYLHCSPMAQEVWDTLESNNLDPMQYGFVNDGDDYDACWSLIPSELLWMVCAAQQELLDNFESRISALENNNG